MKERGIFMKNTKTLALVVSGIMAAAMLTGCSADQAVQNNKGQSADSDKVYNVGICQLVQHEALDAATDGFMDALSAKLGDNVKFDEQNASNDAATCSTIVNQFVASDADLIFANATPALQAAASATMDIPIVGTSITDYATALDIADWTGKTGMNITGTSDLAPLAEQAAMFKELLPDAKNIGLLYCSGEANSKYQVDIVTEELEKLGYVCTPYAFSDSNDVAAVVTTACSESDALYIPTDNTAAANTEIINNIAAPANVPIIAGEEGICKGCGIATLSIDYYSIGEVAGAMAYEILVDGSDPADMDIRFAEGLTKKYYAERVESLGITVPDDYVAIAAE